MSFWSCVADLIKTYQTLIVGIVGFGGVMLTLAFNAHLARQQREEELARERFKLRIALLEELKIIRSGLQEALERSEGLEVEGTGVYYLHNVPISGAYDLFLDRIGLLTPEEVSKVMLAYLTHRTYQDNNRVYGKAADTGDRHVIVPRDRADFLRASVRGALRPIEDAIAAIQSEIDKN